MTSLTRGPLPARVYWTRRVMVLGTAFLLVFGLARLLVGGSDASSGDAGQAVQAAATPTAEATLPTPEATATATRKPKQKKTKKEPVLVAPSGPCVDSDVAVTPEVEDAVAGRPVLVVLGLRTITSPACTWRVSPETLTLKINSGEDDIWFSRQCPQAIPVKDVVVRQAVTTKIGVRWSARRSGEDCAQLQWAMPGWYHVVAAALAGEPSDLQFELQSPSPQVITQTPEPEQDGQKSGGSGRTGGQGNAGGEGKNDLKHR